MERQVRKFYVHVSRLLLSSRWVSSYLCLHSCISQKIPLFLPPQFRLLFAVFCTLSLYLWADSDYVTSAMRGKNQWWRKLLCHFYSSELNRSGHKHGCWNLTAYAITQLSHMLLVQANWYPPRQFPDKAQEPVCTPCVGKMNRWSTQCPWDTGASTCLKFHSIIHCGHQTLALGSKHLS